VLRWKLGNLQTFSPRRLADFEKQVATLRAVDPSRSLT
jgi:hypothetical protein